MALRTLFLFMVLDYVLGVICGFKEKELSSEVAFRVILKKATILIVVAVNLDNVFNTQGTIRSMVIFSMGIRKNIHIKKCRENGNTYS